MIQTKLSEIEEEVEESEEMMKDEAYGKEEEGKMMKTDEVEETDEAYEDFTEADEDDYGLDNMEEGDITEADLEEILAELEAEALEEKRKAKKPSEEKEEEDEDEMNEGMGAYEYEEGKEDGEKEAEMEEMKKSSDKISVDELRNIIRDVFMSEMEKTDEAEHEKEGGMEEDFNLEEILAELDEAEEEEKMEEAKKAKKDDDEKEEMKKELKEAIKTINILKSELNEVNLLNAKLLYMNKIFKSKNLSEGQKLKVINALDRAANLNEAKNIYETLKDALVETKKSTIKESVGFASKPMGVAPAKTIVNEDVQVTRMKKLAGIIK